MRGKSSFLVFAVTSICFGLAACGPAGDEPEEEGYVLLQPLLTSVAPSAITLGDTVTILGSDFIAPEEGTLALLLDGEYTDSDGNAHDFVGEIQLDVINPSVAEFDFEEIFFHPTRDKIGSWRGIAALVNRRTSTDDLNNYDESWSPDKDVDLRIEPSIMLSRLRTADDSSCAPVTSATTADQNIELGFKALGLGEATPERPWTVKMNFASPSLQVRYVVPDAFDFWPINGPLNDTVSTPAAEGNQSVEFEVDSGDTVILDPTKTARTVRVAPAVTIGQDVYSEVVLGSMIAGASAEGGRSTVNFVLEVATDDGRTLRRVASLDVWSEVELGLWDGAEQLAERYEAHAVSGCVPGGQVGRNLTYSEGESVTREREVNVKWNAEVASKLGFSIGISSSSLSGEQGWTQSFGIDITESISSESHTNQDITAQLLPAYFGMSYRQLERLERTVDVIYHNACGASGVVGEAQLTNWNFAFDIAQSKECPPPTNLPDAQVY
jgi:hypothetical protein